jgi:hypothetical protein
MRCRYNLHFSWWGLSIDAKMASIVSGLQLALDFMAITRYTMYCTYSTVCTVLYLNVGTVLLIIDGVFYSMYYRIF